MIPWVAGRRLARSGLMDSKELQAAERQLRARLAAWATGDAEADAQDKVCLLCVAHNPLVMDSLL